jgi:hypothetical protein
MGRLSMLVACLITLVIGLSHLIEFAGARRGFAWVWPRAAGAL